MTRSMACVLTGSLVLGLIYVFVVPAGLPYDEPSHWGTVLYYAQHWSLPTLGHRGVTYEAQQGPVAYYLDAVVVHLVELPGSQSASFHAVRILGLLELLAAATALQRILLRVGVSARSSIVATAVFAWNPMLLAMSGSVQNDTLALAFGFAGLLVFLQSPDDDRGIVGAGVLAGLSVLTKLTDWPLVLVCLASLVLARRWRGVVGFAASVAAITGWWFVRNQVIYGDVTARTAVSRAGATFAAYHVHGPAGIGHIVEQVVTYLWLPTEYVRNSISAPTDLKGVVVLLTAGIAVAGLLAARTTARNSRVVVALGLITTVVWLVTYVAVQAAAPRTAYLALPLWFALLGWAASRFLSRRLMLLIALPAATLALDAWTMHALAVSSLPTLIALH